MSGQQKCARPMRGYYGAETICARPLGHSGACHQVHDEREWAGLGATGERCPSCGHEWVVLSCEDCGHLWERPDDVPGSVVLTPEQVAQVRRLILHRRNCAMLLSAERCDCGYPDVLALLEPKP